MNKSLKDLINKCNNEIDLRLKHNLQTKIWKLKNKEKVKKYRRVYYKKNKSQERKTNRKWVLAVRQ